VLAGNVTLVAEAPPELAANFLVVEVEDRFTVMAAALVVGLPKVSSSVVVKALVAAALVLALNAPEVMTNLTPVPGVMVSA